VAVCGQHYGRVVGGPPAGAGNGPAGHLSRCRQRCNDLRDAAFQLQGRYALSRPGVTWHQLCRLLGWLEASASAAG
jgi:hypothetical protein